MIIRLGPLGLGEDPIIIIIMEEEALDLLILLFVIWESEGGGALCFLGYDKRVGFLFLRIILYTKLLTGH